MYKQNYMEPLEIISDSLLHIGTGSQMVGRRVIARRIYLKGITGVRWDSTPGLKKSDIFGLHRIRKETLLIVEGYPDATYFPAF